MKYLILLGDGMADWPEDELGGRTLLQYAHTPAMDSLAHRGRNGLLLTIPEGFHPGSEVANSSILGYDQRLVYEGRGPLEAASIGVTLEEGDLALRCNLVCLEGEVLKNHSCGSMDSEQGARFIHFLQQELGDSRVHFYPGVQYRHLLVVRGGDKRLGCTPPHDVPLQTWRDKMPQALCPEAEETASLLRSLMLRSQELLAHCPLNVERKRRGLDLATSIWPWGGGYRPRMRPLTETYPQLRSGAVITAVDLIRGIGIYAGLRPIDVPGATGLWDTNLEGKARAAIEALRTDSLVYVHVEASDEAGHDGNLELKLRTIENFDRHLVAPILEALGETMSISGEPVAVAVLPDHPTPIRHRTHTAEPVPFCICRRGLTPDSVHAFSEVDARQGVYGLLPCGQFMPTFLSEDQHSIPQ